MIRSQPTPNDPHSTYLDPPLECDLIMKGGITSGVVYPRAILRLAETYRFRSVGGTSAGAIAAAAAVAAEFDREGGGFERLKAVSDQLCEQGFVLNLFQPSAQTRSLYNIFRRLQDSKLIGKRARAAAIALEITRALGRNTPAAFGGGVLVSLGIAAGLASLARGTLGKGALVPTAALAWVGGIAGSASKLGQIVSTTLPQEHMYGLCTGHSDEPGDACVLTDWLYDTLQSLAGKGVDDAPLTLGELENKQLGDRNVGIKLKMVTTNLTQGCPFELPERHNDTALIFRRSDMERLFPKPVVEYLIKHAPEPKQYDFRDDLLADLDGYYLLPTHAEHLPVIFVTRLSLSFPVLLSAVPLYTIKKNAQYLAKDQNMQSPRLQERDLMVNWFSDGGISSNFPIHMFDSWMPTRPTFGLKLYYPSTNGQIPPDEEVVLLQPKDHLDESIQWPEITSVPKFLGAVLDSARNFRDNMQTSLPGYRERVVQIRMRKDEGGLNLNMQPEVIERIGDKGTRAADLLLARYSNAERTYEGDGFTEHQWVRTRALLAQLEREFEKIQRNGKKYAWLVNGSDGAVDPYTAIEKAYERLLDEQAAQSWYANEPCDPWRASARARVHALVELMRAWHKEQQCWLETRSDPAADRSDQLAYEFFADDGPKPEGSLRVTPGL